MSITLGPIFNAQGGKTREWSIIISLFTAQDVPRAIGPVFENTVVENGYLATNSTCSGYTGMEMTISACTLIRHGKNLGRKNETNVLSQAFNEAQSKYVAKVKAGYTEKIGDVTTDTAMASISSVPFPMAVKSWKDQKDKLDDPLFIQPKLDGVRVLATYVDGQVNLVMRRLHDITGFNKVKEDLKHMFESSGLKTFIVDGEVYSHGTNLQTISRIVRGIATEEEVKESLILCI